MSGYLGSVTSPPDASHFNTPETTNGLEEGQISPSDHGSMENISVPTTRKRLLNLTRRTKAKTKKLLKLDGAVGNEQSEVMKENTLDDKKNDPELHSHQLVKRKKLHQRKTADRTLGAIQSISNAVVHPVKSAKSTVTRTTAGQLSKAERPFLSQDADIEFLRAHDNLERAESSRGSSKQDVSDEDQESLIGSHRDKIREMEEHRESLRVAWTTSRHVRRVRVVPKRHITFPDNECFVERDERGDFVRYDWLTWFGYVRLYTIGCQATTNLTPQNLVHLTQDFSAQYIDDLEELPFDIDSSRQYVERLLMASAPWQTWAMKCRAVYRWENPRATGKWLALYVFLWYTHHIMGFLVSMPISVATHALILSIVFLHHLYCAHESLLSNDC